jgi:16S rRNA (cytosine1402-N4)-methyltransferase
MKFEHRPVLLAPTVDALLWPQFGSRTLVQDDQHDDKRRQHGIFVDGTFGRGGHAQALLSRLASDARLVVFDKDPSAIALATKLAAEDMRVSVVHAGFASMVQALRTLEITQVDGIMLDLGVSSPQLDNAERGFSFMRDGPLDMRMDTSQGLTAAQWLAQASVEEMREVIASYGEERFALQIAKTIAARRATRALHTTGELAELVASCVRTRERGQHPATRTFQALRIYLNRELEELACALASALTLLAPKGRLAVISFHSLEDRMVKQCMVRAAQPQAAFSRLPVRECDMPQPLLKVLGRVLPSEAEKVSNSRARSAVLRVAERTDVSLPPEGGRAFVPAEPLTALRLQRRSKGQR